MAYEAQGVHFDGTNDYLTLGSDLTGNANSKSCTGAFWFLINGAMTANYVYSATGNQFQIKIGAEVDTIEILGVDTGASSVLSISDGGSSADNAWHHCMFSFDGTNEHLYIDGADDLIVTTHTDTEIDFTATTHTIGARHDTNFKFGGDLADLQLKFGTYIDLSVKANRDTLYYGGGAVELSGGIVLLAGATSTWHTNDGSGGGFTENGALTDAAANPPIVPSIGSGILRGTKLERARLVA